MAIRRGACAAGIDAAYSARYAAPCFAHYVASAVAARMPPYSLILLRFLPLFYASRAASLLMSTLVSSPSSEFRHDFTSVKASMNVDRRRRFCVIRRLFFFHADALRFCPATRQVYISRQPRTPSGCRPMAYMRRPYTHTTATEYAYPSAILCTPGRVAGE